MIIKTKEVLNRIIDDNFKIYESNKFMLFSTVIFDQQIKKYKCMSLRFSKNFEDNFEKFFIKKQYLRRDYRSKKKKLEIYLFAKVGKKEYRLGQWINGIVPTEFMFKKSRFKNQYFYIKIPKNFIAVKYKNKNTRSILIIPKHLDINKNFARQLGIFASDGFKTSSLGITNTDLFLVKELKKLFLYLNVNKRRLEIISKKQKKKEWNTQYSLGFDNKILREFINQLHVDFLDIILKYLEENKKLAIFYIQGFHAGDGSCSKRIIPITSYKGDPGLEFIKSVSKKLGIKIGMINKKHKNYETIIFTNLPTYLNFYKYFIWHPKKLDKAIFYLKRRDPFILLDNSFLENLSDRKMGTLSKMFETDIRTVYRYLKKETFIPFTKLMNFCKKEELDPKSLTNRIQQIRTSRQVYRNELAREIYRDFIRLNGGSR